MDAAGAAELRKRLEQQHHWRLAEAVRDGRQPATDPDFLELEEIGDGVRLYRAENGAEGHRMTKRLVDGHWQTSYEVDGQTAP